MSFNTKKSMIRKKKKRKGRYTRTQYTKRMCWDLKKKNTCYKKKDLVNIATKWNKDNPNNAIPVGGTKSELWNNIRIKMGDDEKAWGDNNLVKMRFATDVPEEWNINDHTWLDNFTLDRIMKFFERKYKGFHFENATSLDFERKDIYGNCVVSGLCKYKMKDLVNKYTSFGTILNTDPSHLPGKHWNALYVDIKKRRILFYDSFGSVPHKEVKVFVERLKKEGDEIHGSGTWNIQINNRSHQKSSSECGMYSVYFIIRMVVGESFESFTSRDVTDDYVNCLRGVLLDDVKGTYNKRCNIRRKELLSKSV